ncbi:acyl-CoA thioester hydrolase/BAAT C-terminal domain-containing protein [Streptomyces sp. AF1A]|jgi:hypothetical protein|uniref:acyl-CoA thioester hydrolase/BAAT C-terminal domain-containing protein n=1 Tax=Streptomyces sp. AF1A TaxID=3394350 RepID=UPI0039BD1CBF
MDTAVHDGLYEDRSWPPFWAHLSDWHRCLRLADADHNSFTDIVAIAPQVPEPVRGTLQIGTIPADRAVAAVRATVRAFFDLQLRRRPDVGHRSSWTWRGQALPFVAMDDSWTPAEPGSGPVAIRGWYERSERTFAHLLASADIPVDRARADVLLVAGGDDSMWPSLPFAEQLARRRRSAGATVRLIARHDAGHRPRLPGESPASASPRFLYGGTPEADALLGAAAWPHILHVLRSDG